MNKLYAILLCVHMGLASSNDNTDPYAVLGVPKEATTPQIRAAYKKLSLARHPDRNGGSLASQEKFKELVAAYEILNDPAKRARHDQESASVPAEQWREEERELANLYLALENKPFVIRGAGSALPYTESMGRQKFIEKLSRIKNRFTSFYFPSRTSLEIRQMEAIVGLVLAQEYLLRHFEEKSRGARHEIDEDDISRLLDEIIRLQYNSNSYDMLKDMPMYIRLLQAHYLRAMLYADLNKPNEARNELDVIFAAGGFDPSSAYYNYYVSELVPMAKGLLATLPRTWTDRSLHFASRALEQWSVRS